VMHHLEIPQQFPGTRIQSQQTIPEQIAPVRLAP
jgi:hypothetical protein